MKTYGDGIFTCLVEVIIPTWMNATVPLLKNFLIEAFLSVRIEKDALEVVQFVPLVCQFSDAPRVREAASLALLWSTSL